MDSKPNRRRSILQVDPQKFWTRIRKPIGCWLYDGAREVNGYGYLKNPLGDEPKYITAHRLAWILTHGPIPAGMMVMHTCDVRACVNPEHLRLGTHQENMDDKAQKGRCGSKLNIDQARAIRAAFQGVTGKKEKGDLNRKLAAQYGVNEAQIWSIRTGRRWKYA